MGSDHVGRPDEPGDVVELGSIVGVFGVTGEVRVHLHNPSSPLLRAPRSVILQPPGGPSRRAVLSVRPGAGKRILGRIEGLEDREVAATLTGTRILVPVSELPPEDEGEIYVHRLIGSQVRIGDAVVGELVQVHDTGPTVILEITTGGRENTFVPYLDEFVEALRPDEHLVLLREGALDEP